MTGDAPQVLPRGGRRIVFTGALAAALLVAQQVVGKVTRDALYLSHYPAASLPPLMIAASLLAMTSAYGVSRLFAVRPPRQVLPALVGFHGAVLLGLTALAFRAPATAAILVYFQMAATGGTLLSGYWSVVNERFDPWTAKYVMRPLGVGASLGGIAGGLLAWLGAQRLPVPALLLVVAALTVAALVAIVRFAGDAAPAASAASATPSLVLMREASYLRDLAWVVALGAATDTLLDYLLKARAAQEIAGGAGLTGFFAVYHTAVGVLAFAFQWLLVRPGLETLGLAGVVALRPVAVAAASVAALFDPRLWSAALSRGAHEVLSHSLFRSGYELLYTPIPEHRKRPTKQLVDVGFDRLGTLVGAAAAFAAVRLLPAPEMWLLAATIAGSLAALGLSGRLHRGYVAALEESLRAGRVRLASSDVIDSTTRLTLAEMRIAPAAAGTRTQAVVAEAPHSADPLVDRIADLRSADPGRVRRALEASDDEPALVPHLARLLARNDFYRDALQALRRLAPRAVGQIVDLLVDPETPAEVRRRLPRVLKAVPSPRAVDGLVLALNDGSVEIRVRTVQALTALLARAPELQVDQETVFAAVRRELAEGPPQLDHVFALLALVLDREPLRMASWAVRGGDARLRGTALEYLANVLPADIRATLWPYLGSAPAAATRPLSELVEELSSGRVRYRRRR